MSLPLGKDTEFDELLDALAAPLPDPELFTGEWWKRYNVDNQWPDPLKRAASPWPDHQAWHPTWVAPVTATDMSGSYTCSGSATSVVS
jgi:hypothetical protein